MKGNWYLLQCKARQVDRAETHLKNQGFEFYSPRQTVRRLHRGAFKSCDEPLFPGYLFICLYENSNWRALVSTRGVSRLVSFNDKPHPVPESLISALRYRLQVRKKSETLYHSGERVVVTEGCFRYVEAIVQSVTPDERVIVLLNFLQSKHTVTFSATHLAKTV